MPGNRLKPGTVTGASLAPGSVPGTVLVPGSVGGKQIDEATLGPVPNAVHAERADSATDAETALNAVNAVNATTVNGHSAGCLPSTQLFAGACWQTSAQSGCSHGPRSRNRLRRAGRGAARGASARRFRQTGVTLEGEEWSSDISEISGKNAYVGHHRFFWR